MAGGMRLSPNQLALAGCITALPVLAFVFGWLGESALPRSAIRGAAAPSEWALSRAAERDLAADMNLLASKRPFGASIGGSATSPAGATGAAGAGPGAAGAANPPVQWRLGGIVITKTSRRLVVLSRPTPQSAERSELCAEGETLPDGSVVQSIDPGSVAINREGMLVTLRMFAKD
jgi:hypothetical protein